VLLLDVNTVKWLVRNKIDEGKQREAELIHPKHRANNYDRASKIAATWASEINVITFKEEIIDWAATAKYLYPVGFLGFCYDVQ
jgi:DNA primase